MTDDGDARQEDTWEGMIEWLVESFSDQPVGLVIDLGPRGYVAPLPDLFDDAEPLDATDRLVEWGSLDDADDPFAALVAASEELDPDEADDQPEDEVVCAQTVILEDGVVLVRRSRTVLARLRLADHHVAGLSLDRWHYDDAFADGTHGYLFTRDIHLAAEACVSWFRDQPDAPALTDLGCSYETPDTLPRHLPHGSDAAEAESGDPGDEA